MSIEKRLAKKQQVQAKEQEVREQAKVEQSTTEDMELAKLKKEIAVDNMVADARDAKARREASEAGYKNVKDLLAKAVDIEERASKVAAMIVKNVEVLAGIKETKAENIEMLNKVVKIKAENDKAMNWSKNLALTMQASGIFASLEIVQRSLRRNLSSGGGTGTASRQAPEIRAFNRIKTLLTEGRDISS